MGRTALTDRQIQDIDDRMSATMRRLARDDPARWRGLPESQRIMEASQRAVADIQHEASVKAERATKQVLAVARVESEIQGLMAAFAGKGRAETLSRHFELTHAYEAAIRREALGDMGKMLEAAGDKTGAGAGRRFLMMAFDAENPIMTRDIVREIYQQADGHTSNPVAREAARAWLDVIEGQRQRYNAAGGDVGKLEYGYVPQPHDRTKIRKAGADAWSQAVLPLLDRRQYLREDGSPMSDADVTAMLHSAWEAITSGGLNKAQPGEFKGSGKRANRHGDERQIHFANGEAWNAYASQFGSGTLYDAMTKHIAGMTKDIALVERYGPDIQANAKLQFDLAARADGRDPNNLTGPLTISPQTYWDMITGKTGMPVSEELAQGFKWARDIQTAAKLGGAVISSVTDLGTLALTAGYNSLPYWQLVKDIGSQGSKDTREWMTSHGMIAESAANALNRWSGDHLANGWSGKLANATMRLSLMNAWTDGLRQGFVMTMNAGLARWSRDAWGALAESDRVRLQRAGITEADWAALNCVALETFKGRELLTPQAIKNAGHPELAAKVFGFIQDESEFAIVNPDLHARAISTWGGKEAGTWAGEIARTVMQFKSFPIAMFTRHWGRMLDDVNGTKSVANRAAYGFALMATLVGLGAVATQEKALLQGKDPIDMTKPKFWAKALAQGGGLGIAGDMILVDPSGSPVTRLPTQSKTSPAPRSGLQRNSC
jgi:hypothetical protein